MADDSVSNSLSSSPKKTISSSSSSSLTSPWSHVVRGESEALVSAAPSSPSPTVVVDEAPQSDTTNVARAKKAAWNKPSNGGGGRGDVEIIGGGSIMGAVSWPALSESAKNSPKSSANSLKDLSEGSISVPQGPLIEPSPKKLANSNANTNPNSNSNNLLFNRQKSMKRNGGGGGGPGSNSGGHIQPHQPPPSPPPPLPLVETSTPPNEFSPRDPAQQNNNWENGRRGGFVGNGQPNQQRPFRRSNSGPHQRGNHGGRRDQNLEWNPHRSFNGRDYQMQQQQGAHRNFMGPLSPGTAPFINSPYIRPFGNPMPFPEMAPPLYYVHGPPPESIRGVPFVPAPFGMFLQVPSPEAQVHTMIMKQIDYYFSTENLVRDIYLRRNMDEEGWVPVSLIAGFSRVSKYDILTILDAVQASTVVELKDEKIRRRNDWVNWLLAPANNSASTVGPQTQSISNHDMLSNQMENIRLADGSANGSSITEEDIHNESPTRCSSSDFNEDGQSQFQRDVGVQI